MQSVKTKKTIWLLLAVLFVGIMTTSCGTSRRASETLGGTEQKSAQLSEYAKYGKWNTLVTSGKVALGGEKKMSSSMQLKMVRGKSISISLRPLLGIEVAKIHIEGDDIVIIDRLHKLYIKEKASLLTSGVPVDVSTMQDLLLGRAHILGKGTLSATMKDDVNIVASDFGVVITPKEQYHGFEYGYTYNVDKELVSLEVKPVEGSSIYSVVYGGVQTSEAGNVATTTQVATKINDKALSLELNMKNHSWNAEINNDLDIPQGYSQSTASSILKAMGATVK
jgi:hypothetical protein